MKVGEEREQRRGSSLWERKMQRLWGRKEFNFIKEQRGYQHGKCGYLI